VRYCIGYFFEPTNLGIENGTELPALLLFTNEQYFSYKNVTLLATPPAEANSLAT
jgi:hypothetical protein